MNKYLKKYDAHPHNKLSANNSAKLYHTKFSENKKAKPVIKHMNAGIIGEYARLYTFLFPIINITINIIVFAMMYFKLYDEKSLVKYPMQLPI